MLRIREEHLKAFRPGMRDEFERARIAYLRDACPESLAARSDERVAARTHAQSRGVAQMRY
jgi:hypothetical protein